MIKPRPMYQNVVINVHIAYKYYFDTLLIFAIIKDLRLWSGSVKAGHSDSSPFVRSSLTCKWPTPPHPPSAD